MENESNPTTQPEPKISMTLKSKEFIALRIKSNFASKIKIKEPEIPGKIMAQIAIAPETKTNQSWSLVAAGVREVIKYADRVPRITQTKLPGFIFLGIT